MKDEKFPIFPIILIVLGAFWFAQEMNWITTAISFFPILLIIIGLGILLNKNK